MNWSESKFGLRKLKELVFHEAQKYNKIHLNNKEVNIKQKFKELEQLNYIVYKDTRIAKFKNPNNISVRLHEFLYIEISLMKNEGNILATKSMGILRTKLINL